MQDRRKDPGVSVSLPAILLVLVAFGGLVGIKIRAAGEASGVAAPNDLRRVPVAGSPTSTSSPTATF